MDAKQTCPLAACLSFIYSMSHLMAQAFYPPPHEPHALPALLPGPSSTRAGYPQSDGLHELAAPKMHRRHVTMPLVGSYPTFSPFHPSTFSHAGNAPCVFSGQGRSPALGRGCCYFLLHYSTLADCFCIRKWDALCCPDFPLSASMRPPATDRPAAFRSAKVRKS